MSNDNRPRPTFRGEWCECATPSDDPVYMPDDVCPCGVDKHHYHCTLCGAISQVG